MEEVQTPSANPKRRMDMTDDVHKAIEEARLPDLPVMSAAQMAQWTQRLKTLEAEGTDCLALGQS